MASTLQNVIETLVGYVPAVTTEQTRYSEIYEANCHRIYSLSFWMTDNELSAEQLSANTFLRVFANVAEPTTEQIDRAFLAEIRELTTVGTLTLTPEATAAKNIHGNVKRIHLERAVVQLPATEKLVFLMHDVEGYEHDRIARLLGLTQEESRLALHQARVEIRNLVSRMS
jgi:RNA polymerase sigma-70 factor, ECF subfamily